MTRLQALGIFWRLYREGVYWGDAAVLKTEVMGGGFSPSESLRPALDALTDRPDFSEIDFSGFAEGTLGQAYGQFMRLHGLKPLRFSGDYPELELKHRLVARYTALHDLFHVLTGYDTSWAGEAGVWSFVAGQGISPAAERAARWVKVFYPFLSPWNTARIHAACAEGRRNGRGAESLILVDFAPLFPQPLQDVRKQLRVIPTAL